tara:strand:+ start:306 stop:1286 length:981 start_codon:yes stop_codon:yes gene_type:complete
MNISLSSLESLDGRLVKECVDDMLWSLDSWLDPEGANNEGLEFSMENLELTYRIAEKQRELPEIGCPNSSPEIFCEYCGDNSTHVMQVRGGGGLDEMCVTWDRDIQTGEINLFFSCQSCCQDEADLGIDIMYPQMPDTCIGCGIHTTLKGDEGAAELNNASLCLQNSRGVSATDYYFCTECFRNPRLGLPHNPRRCELEELVIERIKRNQRFINGGECDNIRIPEGYDLPSPPSTEIGSENVRRVLFPDSDDDLEMTSDEELSDTYEGEYENEELPENNTEKAAEIKEAIKEVGEKMFDLQEQLKEGDYLEIMNLLQKVTNKVNSL